MHVAPRAMITNVEHKKKSAKQKAQSVEATRNDPTFPQYNAHIIAEEFIEDFAFCVVSVCFAHLVYDIHNPLPLAEKHTVCTHAKGWFQVAPFQFTKRYSIDYI